MKVRWVRVGDLLRMDRQPIDIDPSKSYSRIGIYSWGKGLLHRPAVPGSEMGSLRYFTFPEGALILSNIQAWEAAVAVTGPADAGFVASNRFLPYVPIDATRVRTDYLWHYFLSDRGLADLRRASPGTQVRNRTLGKTLFESLEVPLPSIEDQRRVALHLHRLLGIRTSPAVEWLDAAMASVMSRFAWTERLGLLLKPDIVEVPVQRTGSYRLMGVFGGGRGAIDRGRISGADTSYKSMYQVRTGQVVLSRLKAFEGAVTTVPSTLDGAVVSKEFPVFSVQAGVDTTFVSALLRDPRLHDQMRAASTGIGARRERLSADSFLAIRAPLPSREAQRRIAALHSQRNEAITLAVRSRALASALPPAARNKIFGAMR